MRSLISLIISLINSGLTSCEVPRGAVLNWAQNEEGYQLHYHVGKPDEDIVETVSKYYTPMMTPIHTVCRHFRIDWKDENNVLRPRYTYITEVLTEDEVLLESLVTRSCSDRDMMVGINPGDYSLEEPNKEVMIYMTEDGVCHRRTYDIKDREMTATITRSEMKNGVECTQEMKIRLEEHMHLLSYNSLTEQYKGFVLEWSPPGKYLQTNFTKDSIEETTIDIEHSFVGQTAEGVKYRLVCKENTIKGRDSQASLITGTVVLAHRITLDRFKLTSCTADSINYSFLPTINDSSNSIIFRVTDGRCFRRDYEITMNVYDKYSNKYNVKRGSPSYIACPESMTKKPSVIVGGLKKSVNGMKRKVKNK